MANTINGQTALVDATRERVGIDAMTFLRPLHGEVLRARCAFDGAGGDIAIDDPTIGNEYNTTTGQRVFIVGLEYADSLANTLVVKSKVGAAGAVTLSTYPLAANGGIILPIRLDHCLSPTDQGGVLIFNVTAAVAILCHYVIADTFRPSAGGC